MRIEYVIVGFMLFLVALMVVLGALKLAPDMFESILKMLRGAGG